MSRSIAVVDAFTDKPFAGNPAGVCMLDDAPGNDWMQTLAREMRHSETAFLLPLDSPVRAGFVDWGWNHVALESIDESRAFILRWFTPSSEVNLCGHATLASAHYLFSTGQLDGDEPVHFYTRSGILSVKPDGDQLVMDFPAVEVEAAETPDWLRDVLPGVDVSFYGRAREDNFVELANAGAVRFVEPNLDAMLFLDQRGLIVTAAGEDGFDAVSRFFAPGVGVDEDPVTGSAHCAIGPYWSERLLKDEVKCFQASERGGVVNVRTLGERVELVGHAVTVLQGSLSESV